MRQRPLGVMLIAAVIGGVFAAGLFIPGRVGGVLLALSDAALLVLARMMWPRLRPVDQAVRIAVIVAIAAIAMVKLAR
jgi:uncharacterized protein DUF6703